MHTDLASPIHEIQIVQLGGEPCANCCLFFWSHSWNPCNGNHDIPTPCTSIYRIKINNILKQATSWISCQHSHNQIYNDPRHLPGRHAKTAQFRVPKKAQTFRPMSFVSTHFHETFLNQINNTQGGMPIGQSGPPLIPMFQLWPTMAI